MNTNRLINAISLFRDYEEDIPLGTILCFLHLCDNDEATVGQAENRFKFGKSRTSRNMLNLTDRARPGKAGIDVASTRPDPADYRVTIFFLNDRGKELKAKLGAIMGG